MNETWVPIALASLALLAGCVTDPPPKPPQPAVVVPPGARNPVKRTRFVSLDAIRGSRGQDHVRTRVKLTPILAGLEWRPGSKPPALGLSSSGKLSAAEFEPFLNRAIAYDQDRHFMTAPLPPEGLLRFLGDLRADPGVSPLLHRTTALSVMVLRETSTEVLIAEVFIKTPDLPRFKGLLTDAATPHSGFSTILQWLLNF